MIKVYGCEGYMEWLLYYCYVMLLLGYNKKIKG